VAIRSRARRRLPPDGSQQGVLGEGGIIVEGNGLAQRRFDLSEHCQHHRNGLGGSLSGEPSRKRHARFAFMENEHWPGTLANDEVTLPMAALASTFLGQRITTFD
jgi:hypothetical protein